MTKDEYIGRYVGKKMKNNKTKSMRSHTQTVG